MAKNPSSHNIYSGKKSKMLFQNPNDNLDRFDYVNDIEGDKNGFKSNKNSGSGLSNLGVQLCVQIMNKTAKFIKKMLKSKSNRDSSQDSDF